jgi:carboxymethylenebutenolidase
MNTRIINIKTKDGVAPCQFFTPPRPGPAPAVIFYMDGIGIRPALGNMAARLASHGYYVLLPDLYYRSGPTEPFDVASIFVVEGPERDRLMALFNSLNNKLVMEDTASFLDYLAGEPAVADRKIGSVGYCMGGPFALSAAGTFPERISADASLHGASLATGQPDSPHLLAGQMSAGIYVGIAGIDPHFTAAEKERLESALASAGTEYQMEVYPGVKHGFAVNDTPCYDWAASERHWQQILTLFAGKLSSSQESGNG